MATELERIVTLETQVAHFISGTRIEALIEEKGADITTVNNLLTQIAATQGQILDAIQGIKDQLADHEARLVVLEP